MKQWTVADVMTRSVVTVRPVMSFKEVADLLVGRMISAAPVVDGDGRVLGMVSEVDLLSKIEYGDRLPHHPLAVRRLSHSGQGQQHTAMATAADAMTAPAITVTADASLATAARLLDAARVKRLPVVTEQGYLVGIVSRRDLVRLYTRSDASLRVDVVDALHGALGSESRDISVNVQGGTATLSGLVHSWRAAHIAEGLTRGVPGVITVDNQLAITQSHAPTADLPAPDRR